MDVFEKLPGVHNPADNLVNVPFGSTDVRLLTALHIDDLEYMRLIPGPASRGWMDATPEHFANRCLPLLIANQSGWFILSPITVRATWRGGNAKQSLEIEYLDGEEPFPARSHFGSGILTWNLPYIFRTPPGFNLLARGPANMPKDGISALEGVIETDWATSTFTMNWKLTRTNYPVTFLRGEPICMIVPQRRGELEQFDPIVRPLSSEPDIETSYKAWSESRETFLTEVVKKGSEANRQQWQKDYFQGVDDNGTRFSGHQTKLKLKPFDDQLQPERSASDQPVVNQ